MGKTIWIVLVALIVIILGYWYFKNRSSSPAATTAPSTQTTTPAATSTAPVTTTPAPTTTTSAITIQNFAFSPASMTVAKGTKVTWTNMDSIGHTVRETDGKTGPNSGTLGQNDTYSFTFNTPGTYQYHCSIHPSMTATITVTG